MPRINVYLPNDVYELASRWRDSVSLSEICASAIRDEFNAMEVHRIPPTFLTAISSHTTLEEQLMGVWGLSDALVADCPEVPSAIRETLGTVAARYLDQHICDGSQIAIAGGRQIWCAVKKLSPRRVRTAITALGLHQADPKILHVHPNTLATFLWLLYSPRSEAHIIGTGAPSTVWVENLPSTDHPNYFVISSCSSFSHQSPLAQLIGSDVTKNLLQKEVIGDFAYTFIDANGNPISAAVDAPQFTLSPAYLQHLSQRNDARVMLVAGGLEKYEVIRAVLSAGLCNMLVTDTQTAKKLINVEMQSHDIAGH